MVNWLFRKYPRTKKVCAGCSGSFGLARPNYPYCSAKCKEKYKPPEQYELPLQKPPEELDEFVKLLKYP